jgi:hypothetical protein
MGRNRSGEKKPFRTRHSNSKKCHVNVSWLTIIMTVKYAAKSPTVKPLTAPPCESATVAQTTSWTVGISRNPSSQMASAPR